MDSECNKCEGSEHSWNLNEAGECETCQIELAEAMAKDYTRVKLKEVSMHIKEIYRIWEDTGFKDNDMKKAFERAINTRSVIALIIEANRLRDNLEEISESDCLGDVAKILRNAGID